MRRRMRSKRAEEGWMERRQLIVGLGCVALTGAMPAAALAQPDPIAQALRELAGDESAIEFARGDRERFQRVEGDPAGVQGMSWRRASQNAIAPSARDLIITCEVSSQSVYETRYQAPTWPHGESGVTIGIGY